MNLQFFSYNIPFVDSFTTASSNFNARKGIIIKLNKNGLTALGEAAPLRGFSPKTLDEVKQKIRSEKIIIIDFFNSVFSVSEVEQLVNPFQGFPSIQFGLFTTAAVYSAQRNKKSIHHQLFDHPGEKIKMNAVVDLNATHDIKKIARQVENGFDTVKIKVGSNPQQSLKRIKEIRTAFKDLKIRLDANQSFTLDEATDFITRAQQYRLEYCEEPLKNPSIQNMLMLKGAVSVPLALDETMAYWPKIEDQAFIADIFVLKPMLAGSQATISGIYRFAQKHHKEIVFTSSLGTAVERLMTASLAAGYGSEAYAHGLHTGRLLKEDLWDDSNLVNNGQYNLPTFRQFKQLTETETEQIQLNPIS